MAGYHCILLVHRNLQDSRVNKYDAVMLNGSLKSTVIVVMGNFVCEILCSTASDDSWRGASPKTTQKTTPKSTPKTTPKRTPNSQKCKMAWTYGWYWGMCRYRQSWTRIADIRVHTRWVFFWARTCAMAQFSNLWHNFIFPGTTPGTAYFWLDSTPFLRVYTRMRAYADGKAPSAADSADEKAYPQRVLRIGADGHFFDGFSIQTKFRIAQKIFYR